MKKILSIGHIKIGHKYFDINISGVDGSHNNVSAQPPPGGGGHNYPPGVSHQRPINEQILPGRPNLDISALKKQYARLRERQRQAHIILTGKFICITYICFQQIFGLISTFFYLIKNLFYIDS